MHGILGQPYLYWNVLRRRLQRDGFPLHEASLPYGLLGDIRVAAVLLRDRVEEVLAASGADRLDVVCHSAGGLVVRYYLHFLRGHRHVAHVVHLGVPHGGTALSRVLPLPVAVRRQTAPASGLIQELDAAPPLPDDVRVTNLWSPTDGIVVPARHALLEGARNIELPWTHHWGMLWSRRAHDAVLAALRDAADGEAAGATGDA